MVTPLARRTVPVHDPTGLGLDLSGLDRGTAAHELTIDFLRARLAPVPLEALSRPRVDAAWRHLHDLATLFVAEVKSLTGARQEQQIRLGIGQVLDYAHAVRTDPPVGSRRRSRSWYSSENPMTRAGLICARPSGSC